MCVFLLATSILASAILAMTIQITILGMVCKNGKLLNDYVWNTLIGSSVLIITWWWDGFMYFCVQKGVIGLMAMHVWGVIFHLTGRWAGWTFFPARWLLWRLLYCGPIGPLCIQVLVVAVLSSFLIITLLILVYTSMSQPTVQHPFPSLDRFNGSSMAVTVTVLFLKFESFCKRTGFAKYLQSSAVITRSNVVRYYINNYRNRGRISIRCWIHKRHSIPRPNGRAMCCLLWIFVRNWPRYNGTALYLAYRGRYNWNL